MIRYYFSLFLCILSVHAEELSASYVLSWTTQGDSIVFDIQAKTLGWVGLGFHNRPSMKGADIAVAGVKASGENYVFVSFS